MMCSPDTLNTLLQHGDSNIEVAETLIDAAAQNQFHRGELIEILIQHFGNRMKITERLLVCIGFIGLKEETLNTILDTQWQELEITENLLECFAAYAWPSTMNVLLKHRAGDVNITDWVALAMARNRKYSLPMIYNTMYAAKGSGPITEDRIRILENATGVRYSATRPL